MSGGKNSTTPSLKEPFCRQFKLKNRKKTADIFHPLRREKRGQGHDETISVRLFPPKFRLRLTYIGYILTVGIMPRATNCTRSRCYGVELLVQC